MLLKSFFPGRLASHGPPMISYLLLGLLVAQSDGAPVPPAQRFEWGTITRSEWISGESWLGVSHLPASRKVLLPESLSPIAGIWPASPLEPTAAGVEYSADGKQAWMRFSDSMGPTDARGENSAEQNVAIATAARSGQWRDGRIVFIADDAEVSGPTARLVTQSLNRHIVAGTDREDLARWKYSPTRPGRYAIDLTYSLTNDANASIEFAIGDTRQLVQLAPTGGGLHFHTVPIGEASLSGADPVETIVRCVKLPAGTTLNFRSLIFRPVSEGKPVVQTGDGTVICHARDVTILGVKVQYEPRPEKNTVGYWVNVDDRIRWDFEIRRPGRFAVEILQGCGKDQGGSDVELIVGSQVLKFVVEDTGHFQNFKPRTIGEVAIEHPGRHWLLVHPIRKPGIAVMDLRQVRLIPMGIDGSSKCED
jgi:hypothetical protein